MTDRQFIPDKEQVGEQVFEESVFKFLAKKYAISKEEIIKLVNEKKDSEQSIPLEILRTQELSSLEAITKFLRENRKWSYKKIGQLLNREAHTLATTYAVAKRKKSQLFSEKVEKDSLKIPFTAFKKNLSILEAICTYLHSINYTYVEISKLLLKNQRTIWTVCNRAKKKIEQGKIQENNNLKQDLEHEQ